MNETGTIYALANTVNDKLYIGQTTRSVHERLMQHLKPCTLKERANYKIYQAIKEIGTENFYAYAIEENIPKDLLDEKEIYYIDKFDTYNNGYNSTYGADTRIIHKQEDIDTVMRMYKEGYSTQQIADKFNVCSTTVLRVASDIGYHHNPYIEISKEELQECVDKNMSNQEIAYLYHTNKWTIQRRKRKYNIKSRKTYLTNRTDLDYDEIKRCFENNESQVEISDKFNLSAYQYRSLKKKFKAQGCELF